MDIRVHIQPYTDFGREMAIAVIRIEYAQDGSRNVFEHSLAPRPDSHGGVLWQWVPIKEGERISSENMFMIARQSDGDAFLRAMAVALAQQGYTAHDPHGTRAKEIENHLASAKQEAERHYTLLNKAFAALTTPPIVVQQERAIQPRETR